MAEGSNKFWSDHSIEPKRKFRWTMGFNGIPYWLLKKASRPTINVSEAEHVFLNYKFYFPGRIEYDEMSVTIADPLHPDASAVMMQLLHNAGYVTPDQIDLNAPRTITKKAAVESVGGKLFMQQIDSGGVVVEEWQFWNPWIKSVNFDEGDYESDDLINLEVTFRYDWASLNPQLAKTPSIVASTGKANFEGLNAASSKTRSSMNRFSSGQSRRAGK